MADFDVPPIDRVGKLLELNETGTSIERSARDTCIQPYRFYAMRRTQTVNFACLNGVGNVGNRVLGCMIESTGVCGHDPKHPYFITRKEFVRLSRCKGGSLFRKLG